MDDLKALSAAASPGWLYVAETAKRRPEQEGDFDTPCYTMTGTEDGGHATVTVNPAFAGWNTDGGCGGYGLSDENARFIAALWNAYRDGRLVEQKP